MNDSFDKTIQMTTSTSHLLVLRVWQYQAEVTMRGMPM